MVLPTKNTTNLNNQGREHPRTNATVIFASKVPFHFLEKQATTLAPNVINTAISTALERSVAQPKQTIFKISIKTPF
jgi:hypothetical protein